jgi:hypothetical protein
VWAKVSSELQNSDNTIPVTVRKGPFAPKTKRHFVSLPTRGLHDPSLHVDTFGGADKESMQAHTMRLASADLSLVVMKQTFQAHTSANVSSSKYK